MAQNLSLMHQIYSLVFFQFLIGFLCMGISLAQQWFLIGILKLLLYASTNGNPYVLTYPATTATDGYRAVRMSNYFVTWFSVKQSLVLHEVLILIQYEFKACMLLASF